MDPGEDPEDTLRAHRSRERTFIFDTVFDQHASQVHTTPSASNSRSSLDLDSGLSHLCLPQSLPEEQGGCGAEIHSRDQAYETLLWTQGLPGPMAHSGGFS